MDKINVNTVAFNGSASEQIVAVRDDRRLYMSLYCSSGDVLFSLGEGDHATTGMALTAGDLFDSYAIVTNKITYTGISSKLIVITNTGSPTVLTSDFTALTYDGVPLTYNNGGAHKPVTPVFS